LNHDINSTCLSFHAASFALVPPLTNASKNVNLTKRPMSIMPGAVRTNPAARKNFSATTPNFE
jgi:hypothetical protein